MLKYIFQISVFLFASQILCAQSNLNAYKYVIVPTKFEFTKEADAYKLNSLTKYKFEKLGFKVLMDNEQINQEIINNGCLALEANVIKLPGIFTSKLQIELKNCKQDIVFQSKVGTSREKKYHVAYNLALREAFESFNELDYQFQPTATVEVEASPIQAVVLEKEETTGAPHVKNPEPLLARSKGLTDFELVNQNNEVVYTLIFSGKTDFYMVSGMQATVYKENGVWVIAKQLANGTLQITPLNVSF
ncbi:hypothetical protein ACFSQP_08340 [Bizionia sediminis]|uniref:Uncharacterized protein n=1 Tax=Bizionia sediminis TaxID=1737064 RepID=A0ABW5KS44_9FLAO